MPSQVFGKSQFLNVEGNRRLHFMEQGEGEPTVVFEAGLGFGRSSWAYVAPEVARHTRTVVYDRAGLGLSDPDRQKRTLNRICDDQAALLDHLGPGPFILVGHSYGGPMVRIGASRNPNRIRGLVLVDQSDENAPEYFSPRVTFQFGLGSFLNPLLARTPLYKRMWAPSVNLLPEDIAADIFAEDLSIPAVQAASKELRSTQRELRKLQNNSPELGDIEVAVLTGTKPIPKEQRIRDAIIPAHRKTVASLRNARLVEAPNSGHLINLTEPQIVIDEILKMVSRQ